MGSRAAKSRTGRKFISESSKMGFVLRLLTSVSAVLMAYGLALYMSHGGNAEGLGNKEIVGFRQAVTGALALEPVPLMALGLIILLLIPFVRVGGVFFTFLAVKDLKYALISLGVLLVLVVSLFIPGFK